MTDRGVYNTVADGMITKAYVAIDELANEVAHVEGDNRSLIARVRELEAQVARDKAVIEAVADVIKWDGVVQGFYRKERRGEEINISEISDANSEWSDAMDRLRAALAAREER